MTSGNICCVGNKCGCTAACKWSMREVIYERVGDSYSRGDILQPTTVPIGSNNKFLTFKNSPLDNDGVFQRNVGLKEKGIILLKEYCKQNKINYDEELQKFK